MTPEERAEKVVWAILEVLNPPDAMIYADQTRAEIAKLIASAITEAVAEEREAIARLMCGFCSHGRPLVPPTAFTTEWQHELKLPDTSAWNVPCKAQSIRARAVSR